MSKGFLQNIKKMQETPTDATEPVQKAAEPVQKAAEPITPQALIPAPWALKDCPQCKRSKSGIPGISDKGTPCNICSAMATEERESNPDQPVVSDFDLVVGTDGSVSWNLKGQPVVETKPVEDVPPVKEVVESKGGDTFKEAPLEDDPIEEAPIAPTPKVLKPKTPPADESEKAPLTGLEDTKAAREAYAQERTGSKGFVLSYVPVRNKVRSSKKLGEPNCVAHISEVTALVSAHLLEVANAKGHRVAEFLELSYFERRDLINLNGKAIAEIIGNSIIDASSVLEASDDHVICSAVERYASCIYGSAK